MVDMGNNVFASSYINNQGDPSVVFHQYNQILAQQSITQLEAILHLQMCGYSDINNDYVLLVYGNWVQSWAALIQNNGTIAINAFLVEQAARNTTFTRCQQINQNEIIILQENWNHVPAQTYTLLYSVFNAQTRVFRTQGVAVEPYTGDAWGIPSTNIIDTDRLLISFVSRINDTSNIVAMVQEYQLDMTPVNGNIIIPTIGGEVKDTQIQAYNNGDYVIVYTSSPDNVVFNIHISWQAADLTTSICNTFVANGNKPVFNIHGNMAYISYIGPVSQFIGVVVDLQNNCNIVSSTNINDNSVPNIHINSLWQSISQDTDEVGSVVLNFQFQVGNPNNILVQYQYQIEQTTPCAFNTRCRGCYILNECPICTGSTDPEKLNRQNPSMNCLCQDSQYDDPLQEDCQDCSARCLTCENNSTNCLTCRGTDPNLIPAQECRCGPTFYPNPLDDEVCIPCQYPCLNCSDANTCLSCRTSVDRINNSACDCESGYFDNGSNCQACYRRCGACQSDGVTCIVHCDTNCGFCDPTGKCLRCLMGYYLDENSQCIQQCNPKCVACSIDLNKCLLCSNGIGRSMDLQQQCGCQDGYYDDGTSSDCKPCKVQFCRVCDQNGECIECENSNLDPKNCLMKIVTQETKLPYKKENGNIVCKPGQNRINKYPCNCQEGYYSVDHTFDCKICPQYCINCLNESLCTKCTAKRILNKFSGQCECQNGLKEDQQGICRQCYQYQGNCFYDCPEIG